MARGGDSIPVSPGWIMVLIAVGGIALGTGKILYAPKADYATKSQVDSLRWQVEGTNARLDVLLLMRAPSGLRVPEIRERTGRRP